MRKQKRIGQQQVAEQLGVHRNTVGAWERGEWLPDTRGMVLELARCLHLDEQETVRLLEASLTGVSTRWNVPYRRNPFFTGREELMQRLHTLLRQEKRERAILLCCEKWGGKGKRKLLRQGCRRGWRRSERKKHIDEITNLWKSHEAIFPLYAEGEWLAFCTLKEKPGVKRSCPISHRRRIFSSTKKKRQIRQNALRNGASRILYS